ncbi:hypothetical protein DFA_07290 [Cavenderia fasciculata]|uniref:Uncharacterized protein n=1 Tax=Cavenderia fasciculata TaxID=261658 RepID=F4PW06_CACFS|nr:hypothetical protein DFA_07290 [Cavenderia fasciculata]EGG20170.1 hypothetical protein DFA_07290 [Cavenderia fasciculata]|eukprot:XP_004367153.1 hypothetical protein DFA_07290 [Cavenderia fasciculata]
MATHDAKNQCLLDNEQQPSTIAKQKDHH